MGKILLRSALALACLACLGGCGEKASFSPTQQAGGDPTLPAPQRFLTPPMQVPERSGWKEGQTPKVAEGLAVERIASGLKHPR